MNLAYAIARLGGKVGIFDADVQGPSLPTMVALENPKVPFPLVPCAFAHPVVLCAFLSRRIHLRARMHRQCAVPVAGFAGIAIVTICAKGAGVVSCNARLLGRW